MRHVLPSIRSFAAGLLAALTLPVAMGAGDPCAGVANCRNLGPFTAAVVKVNVTRQDNVTAYQGVRTTVRFTNVSDRPLILGYRDRSSAVSDNQGLAYRWSAKAYGIGVVARGSADPQFQLAPGESREASFDGVLQYSMRRQVAGNVFSHDITIVELGLVGAQQVRELRDHAVGFTGLTGTSGFAAGPRDATVALSPPPPTTAGDIGSCAGAAPGSCQAAGPLIAQAVRVNVTQSGNVTAYQTVRVTVRFTNAGAEPLILGWRKGSSAVSDETGQAYRWASKVAGIGVVDGASADPQFRLAPGESREATFESTLQYSVRRSHPGRVFSQDMTVVQLGLVGPTQVRSVHDYALSFSNLSSGMATPGGVAAPDVAQTINKVVDVLKAFKK
ncbi:MAG TPA: hypothetical protein VGF12_23965 [Roseateles sp.]|uniref:hypothetical protein n=1 Tax=Roseateles sp. TaxID=1971397 RepID=UPI002ED7FB94